MFLNVTKFNKYIKAKTYIKLFDNKKKYSLYLQVYNSVDVKPIKNFIYFKENNKSTTTFFKNLKFQKTSEHHLW